MTAQSNPLWYPLRYLSLQYNEGAYIALKNVVATVVFAISLSAMFIYGDPKHFFGERGFLEKIGSFSAVLTGFYIAALVGVASFTSSLGDLDSTIIVGEITRIDARGDKAKLSRRQYVCSMFGYLAFISMGLSITAMILTTLYDISQLKSLIPEDIRIYFIFIIYFFINLALAHMIVTTCHGLYYLIDRLYDAKPQVLPKDESGGA